jgi:hypothetical protein
VSRTNAVACGQEVLTWFAENDCAVLSESPGTLFSGHASSLTVFRLEAEQFVCTPSHPFWVIGQGWTPAASVSPGDSLYSFEDGRWYPVQLVETLRLTRPRRVYDISVPGRGCFGVGRLGILVHNS